jgi:hypothetical protein
METPKKIDWSKFINKPRVMSPIQLEDGHIGLESEGIPLHCIYSDPTPLPHPHIAGQLIIHHKQCNSRCPAFQIKEVYINHPPFAETNILLSCCKATIEVQGKDDETELRF